ncbi:hypothetical protein NIES2109_14050 [Nostoc sp. HK-01]|nr:hypothetical protein NIES2109_14050 [Nostoc sp. HK-01]
MMNRIAIDQIAEDRHKCHSVFVQDLVTLIHKISLNSQISG